MATTPEIKTRFTLDGLRESARGLKAFGRTVSDTLSDARRKGGKVFDPLGRGLDSVNNKAKAASKAILAIGGRGTFRGLQVSALGAGVAVGGLTAKLSAVSAAAVRAAKDSAASLKSISIDAQRIGGSTSDVAVLGYAADRVGTDREEIIMQISTISNEFLTLRENIRKAHYAYSDFLGSTQSQASLASTLGGASGVQQVMAGFADANLEARKASLTDAIARLGEVDAELNAYTARSMHETSATRALNQARMLSLQYERQQLEKGINDFWAAQSPQAQALDELSEYGIDLERATKGGVEGLVAISEAFQKIEDPSKRARVAMRLFGEDAGVKMIPLLAGGRKEIEEYRREMERLGGIATPEDIANAERYTTAAQQLQTAASGVRMAIGRALLPDLTKTSQELTEWLVKSREQIAAFAAEAFKDTRTFAEDALSLFGGNTEDIKTPWLDTVVQKTLALSAVWADVRKQVSLLWEGKDSDYAWLNTLRDGFREVKKFALDAWAVVSGGDAINFTWLNAVRDQVVAFSTRLSDAFDMLKSLVSSIGDFFRPVLEYLGKDVMTVGLFLGLTRMVGLFGLLTTGAGLLLKALGAVFALGGAAAGAAGAAAGAAGGAAGGALATAGTLRLALAGVVTTIGGLTSAAVVLGTTLAGAFMLGQKAAEWWMKDTMAAYEKVWAAQEELNRAQERPYINRLLKDRTDRTVKFREKFWSERGVQVDGRTSEEKYRDGRREINRRLGWDPDYEGIDVGALARESEARRAAAPIAKRVQVDLNVAGRQRTLETDETTAALLLRDLNQATRGY